MMVNNKQNVFYFVILYMQLLYKATVYLQQNIIVTLLVKTQQNVLFSTQLKEKIKKMWPRYL